MNNIKRGEIWLANLNPTKGSEQSGIRPVIIFQNNQINKFTTTIITIPLTTNMKRKLLPSSVFITQEQGNLITDSVALCHQLRVLDKTRLINRLSILPDDIILELEDKVLFTLGIGI
jgi:mRNA interferase MazF